jgi:hypothetical protein
LLGAPGSASLAGRGFPFSHITSRNFAGSSQGFERWLQASERYGGAGCRRSLLHEGSSCHYKITKETIHKRLDIVFFLFHISSIWFDC